MSASNEPRDGSADALLSDDPADMMVPGVVVEVDAAEAERLGAFEETALTEADAWESNADLGDEANMINYLQKASEAGFDVLAAMHDGELGKYRKDPRVLVMVENAKAMRAGNNPVKSARSEVPPLPPLQKN